MPPIAPSMPVTSLTVANFILLFDERLEVKLEEKLDQKLEQKFDEKLTPLYRQLGALRLEMNQRFEQTEMAQNDILNAIGERFDHNQAMLDEHTTTLKKHTAILEKHTAILNEHTASFQALNQRLDQNEIVQSEILDAVTSTAKVQVNHEVRLKRLENKGPHSLWDYHDTKR